MNKVYQHGDELFVTFDATPRLRNLRTGLTITPRVPFKYLGEMPQVGQVWALRSPCRSRFTVSKVSGGDVSLDHPVFLVEVSRLTELYKSFELVEPNHTLQSDPKDLDFSWIGEAVTEAVEKFAGAINSIGAVESPRDQPIDTTVLTVEQAIDRFKQYCMADVGAEKQEPNYIFATGNPEPFKTKATDRRFTTEEAGTAKQHAWEKFKKYCMADVETSDSLVICRNDNCYLVYKKGPTKCPYCCGKSLPLPGQLWAKGRRYVTVDRVEDGRVYYTDGSSGLRRFLNEYANVTKTVGERNREKREQLARGHKSGTQGLKDFGAQMQRYGRKLRPTPTGRIKTEPEMQSSPNRPIGTVSSCTMTENGLHIMFKINDNDVERVKLNVRKAQLKQELRTLSRRLKELSK